ncbi:MAG: hypothetical protein JSR37_08250 [Verrucomicrobia bacterium]|nr:hypothetical protein [Verrucomicrobiota bacterium]MBS0635880.1 hypothetical protein [Verrucomicrobiota bacterium]
MVQPTNTTPPAESGDSKSVVGPPKKDPTQARTSAPNTDDGSRKPFKEVLEATMGDKQLKQPTKVSFKPDDEDDDEKMSLLDLAAGTTVRDTKGKPTITNTAVFRQEIDPDAVTASSALVSMDDDTDVDVKTAASNVHIETRAAVKEASVKQVFVNDETVAPKSDGKTDAVTPVIPKEHTKEAVKAAVVERHIEHKDALKTKDEDVAIVVSTDTKAKVVVGEAKAAEKVDPTAVVITPVQLHATVAATTSAQEPAKVSNVREVMLKLAQSMVDQIQIVKDSGKTDTTFTLKHPPLFEGVEVKITEFDSAKNQFNLTFSDVNNPTARALIEQQDNQVRLQQALVDKGYTVQMVTVEQKIPGLNSTATEESKLGGGRPYDGQAGTATDDNQGNVT